MKLADDEFEKSFVNFWKSPSTMSLDEILEMISEEE